MNLFFIFKLGVVLIAIATNAFLSYLVYRNNPKSATNRIYTTLGLVINLWLIANFTSVIPAFLDQSLWLIRLSLFFATLMSALFYLFASVFPKREYTLSRKRYVFVGVLTFSVAAITLTPLVFSKVDIVNNSPHPVPGPGIGLFTLVTTLFSILAVVTLFKKYHRSKSVEKQQFSYTLLAISILLGLLIITVLLPVIIFKVNATVSLIPLYTVVFLALTTYAIIRHHLFDIRAVIAKSVTYVLLLITLTSVYGVFAFQIGNLVFDTSKISRTQKILNVVLALVVGFSLQPLKRFFEKFTDNIFYKDKYDPQLLLNDVSHVLASEIDMEKLTTKVSSLIKIQMKVSRANIVVIEDKEVIFGGQAFPSLKPSDYQEILQLGKTHI
ncbi:MAG: histidine kinase N-terminal 7TM domain-containing protein, partial [Mucilaginibacter sp.]